MQKYKAILSDIDGTLVGVGTNTISPKVRQAIEKAQEKGVIFVLVSGRSLSLLDKLLEQFKGMGFVIFDNGAGIYDVANKEIVWESNFNSDTANKLLPFLRSYKSKSIGLATTEGRLRDVEIVSGNVRVRKIRVSSFSPARAKEIVKQIQSNFQHLLAVETSSAEEGLYDIYITNTDATKQHAILKLAEILKISTHEMIGVGDHYNDFPLLMACGLKVAMGNAVKELKEIADYIAPPVEEDGIVDVIEKFVLGAK